MNNFNETVMFLCNISNSNNIFKFNLRNFKHISELFYNTLFIKNNTDDIDIDIPIPNIETVFLDMTPIERNIYDSALDDQEKQFELCNHIMVSEQYLSVLGNEPQPLNIIHLKMTEYFSKKIDVLTKRIQNIDKDIEKNILLPNKIIELNTKKEEINMNLNNYKSKFNIFNNIEDTINETEDCPICFEELNTLTRTLTPCGHSYCSTCINNIKKTSNSCNSIKCALCRHTFNISELSIIKNETTETTENTTTMGTKLAYLLNLVKNILNTTNDKIIIFSQFDTFIKLVSKIFNENSINNIFINGSINTVNSKIKKFKLDNTINVVFISSDKSPSGLNLQEASHIILLDSLNTTKENAIAIEDQAIGRAVRIGQTKNVSVKRLIMRNTIEHDMYIRNIST
jgi:SNF2 family DNA or RNA helicase